jgi:uncharacterized protein YggE
VYEKHHLRRRGVGRAGRDAQTQADALAAAAHVRVVRLLAVSTGSYAGIPRPVGVTGRVMAAQVAVPTDVQPSDLSVNATVTVTYEIAP